MRGLRRTFGSVVAVDSVDLDVLDGEFLTLLGPSGSGKTTVLRMTTAYSMLVNGGRRIKATLIDRIQDRYGATIYRHDERICEGCAAPAWQPSQPEPKLIDQREQVLDPLTAYQITSIMEGVVIRGTATTVIVMSMVTATP